ncbi:MAG: hypothetical protein AAGA66_06925 [Bacteroidota bacterium]
MKSTKKHKDVTTSGIDKDTGLPTQFLIKKLIESEQSSTVDQSVDEILTNIKAEGRRIADIK